MAVPAALGDRGGLVLETGRGFTAPKLLWVRANEPEVFARIAHVLLPKDYVRYRIPDSSDVTSSAVWPSS